MHATYMYVSLYVCIYIYVCTRVPRLPKRQTRLSRMSVTFSSTVFFGSLCPKELVKDLLNKQNKIRAFLTARPSEPRRGHVRGTSGKTEWEDRPQAMYFGRRWLWLPTGLWMARIHLYSLVWFCAWCDMCLRFFYLECGDWLAIVKPVFCMLSWPMCFSTICSWTFFLKAFPNHFEIGNVQHSAPQPTSLIPARVPIGPPRWQTGWHIDVTRVSLASRRETEY